ncbi:MAG: septum formation initiator [Epsilonproteobacteria bacterium]|nr:septum formation initiator [Campylobacterota bacterium]
MSKILNEFERDRAKSIERRFYGKIALLVLFVVVLGVYVGDVLFGTSSLEVLLDLQDRQDNLTKNVKIIKQKNAFLQKEYFELKQLEPQ